MPLPFLLSCATRSPLVFELADGKFHLMEPGEPGPLLSGYKHLLVERRLGSFLASLDIERISIEPVLFKDPVLNTERSTHDRIRVGQFFTTDQIKDLPLDGFRLLTLNDQYYFVSPSLKDALELEGFAGLEFSEGLAAFAGNAP